VTGPGGGAAPGIAAPGKRGWDTWLALVVGLFFTANP
jgi:hypothetical protein